MQEQFGASLRDRANLLEDFEDKELAELDRQLLLVDLDRGDADLESLRDLFQAPTLYDHLHDGAKAVVERGGALLPVQFAGGFDGRIFLVVGEDVNGLRLTWVMSLLADAVVILRTARHRGVPAGAPAPRRLAAATAFLGTTGGGRGAALRRHCCKHAQSPMKSTSRTFPFATASITPLLISCSSKLVIKGHRCRSVVGASARSRCIQAKHRHMLTARLSEPPFLFCGCTTGGCGNRRFRIGNRTQVFLNAVVPTSRGAASCRSWVSSSPMRWLPVTSLSRRPSRSSLSCSMK